MLNQQSIKKLEGVHPDLRKVVILASRISPVDFIITEGIRSMGRQRALVETGASHTYNSRHLSGHAVDFAPVIAGEVTWKWPSFKLIARAFKEAGHELGIPIIWGGDWRDFKDGPHIELDRRRYRP